MIKDDSAAGAGTISCLHDVRTFLGYRGIADVEAAASADRMASGPPREDLPLPTQPPYTAFVGNLAFDLTEAELEDFFASSRVRRPVAGHVHNLTVIFSPQPKNAKIIKDRDEKPKGFGYVELEDLDGLKDALARSGDVRGSC